MTRALLTLSLTGLLFGCAATPLTPGAQVVDILDAPPDKSKCQFLGEVMGTQGNWFTGGYTSNQNLMLGARNSIKNEAFKLGANAVLIQQENHANYQMAGGTSNSTLIGKAYKCKG